MLLTVGSSRFDAFVQLLTLIVVFVIVLAITYFATKYIGNVQKEKLLGGNIKVLETLRISNTKYLQIVKIGSKCFVMAVCKDTVTYLCEINEDELVYRDSSGQFKSESFKTILDKFKKDKPED